MTDGVLVARLHGRAGRLALHKVPEAEAVAELQAITTRVDLLSHAAGLFMASYRADPVISAGGWPAADLLLAAGADLELAEAAAAKVPRRATPQADH